ncbi:MAG: molybdate ABC transporter substrate-binding protein [Thiotrichaceae bacterium]|nr:molybdate ABC transporter substrate-binding protein [Thiotrichaceae bacterium]
MTISKLRNSALTLLLLLGNSVHAEEFQVSAADHFMLPLQELVRLFEKDTGNKAIVTGSSVGAIYTKIKEGAPFDIFFSGDATTPVKMEQEGFAVPNTRFTYAIGKLVLWSPDPTLIDKKGEVLKTGNFKHLVLPNTERATYGVVAKQAMEKMDVWEKLKDKLVIAESPVVTYKTIHDGGAELGFLPLATLNPSKKIEGSLWIVPAAFYDRLEHQAVLLKHGENNKAAKDFLTFVKSPRAKNVIESFGYSMPR